MRTVLKKGVSEAQSREARNQVREVVEGIFQGIADHGDAEMGAVTYKLYSLPFH